MLEKVAHYPAPLKAQLERILRSAEKSRVERPPRGHNLFKISETIRIERGDIPDQGVVWVNAILGPCIFIALVTVDDQGNVQEARAGHFSTGFSNYEIDPFLHRDESPDRASIWIAGLAQKTSHNSLRKTADKLIERINASGLPVALEWENEERPRIRNSRDQKIVSDLGFGLATGGENDQRIERIVSLGVTHTQAFLVTTLLRRTTERSLPLMVSLLTSDLGLLCQRFPKTP